MQISIDGVPFYLITNGDGFYVMAIGQKVNINGSPLILSFDPPIAPTISTPDLYYAVKAYLPVNPPILP